MGVVLVRAEGVRIFAAFQEFHAVTADEGVIAVAAAQGDAKDFCFQFLL